MKKNPIYLPLLTAFSALTLAGSFAHADFAVGLGKAPETWAVTGTVQRLNGVAFKGDGTDASENDFAVVPMVNLGADYSLSGLIEGGENLQTHQFDYGRGLVTLKKKTGYPIFWNRTKFVPRVVVGFPISHSAQDASLQNSGGFGGRFQGNPNFIISKKLGLAVDLYGQSNFYQYTTKPDGSSNTQYLGVEQFEASWAFTDKLGLTFNFSHYDTQNYEGVYKDYMSHSQELGYKLNPRATVFLGHAWGNPWVPSRNENQDVNIALLDNTNSVVYAGLTLVL